MSEEEKIVLTPDEAISLLADGEIVHNFAQTSFALVGCDYDRAEAVEAIRTATSLEIGGPACKSLNHALAVHEKTGRYTFFATDPARVEAMEQAKTTTTETTP